MSKRFTTDIGGDLNINGDSGFFKAKYDGVCKLCGFSFEKSETVHYVGGKIAHDTCHDHSERDRFSDDGGSDAKREPSFVIRGKRKPKVCPECHIEHAGECF